MLIIIGTGTIVVFLFTLLFVLNWQRHNFWKSKGVPTPSFWPIIGHFSQLFVGKRWEKIDQIYKDFKNDGFWGMYAGFTPELFVTDVVLIKNIMIKDADYFTDRRELKFSKNEYVFNEMLSILKGEEWKALRAIMSPTFSSGKIKAMFPLIEAKSDELVKECQKLMAKDSYLEMKSLFSYYTMDVIGTCAFGIETHCLQNKGASQFMKAGMDIASTGFLKLLRFIFLLVSPKLFSALGLQLAGDSIKLFINAAETTIKLRQISGERRGDFLDLMLEALEEAKEQQGTYKYPMTMNTVISESVLFLLAGFDTSANALSFLVYLLAKNPDAQHRLRKELQKVVEADEELNYQNVMESNYLDACLAESLRIYSPAHFSERTCTKKYNLPGRDVEIPEGILVGIPIHSIHHDPEYWEDPEVFRPERFLPENKADIKPYTYLPFGLGPRNCIGMRFAQLESKLAIAKLCLNYQMELRPGFTEMVLEKTLNTLRADKNGVQIVLKNI